MVFYEIMTTHIIYRGRNASTTDPDSFPARDTESHASAGAASKIKVDPEGCSARRPACQRAQAPCRESGRAGEIVCVCECARWRIGVLGDARFRPGYFQPAGAGAQGDA